MTITAEATYENGSLKLSQPLPLQEHEKVQVTVQSKRSAAQESAGMLKWTGNPELLRRIAEDDEYSILESP